MIKNICLLHITLFNSMNENKTEIQEIKYRKVKTSILHQFTEQKASVVGISSGIEYPLDILSR